MPLPGENVMSWSKTALDNGNADSLIVWPEGQSRASVNNSSRSEMAAIAKWRDLQNGSIVTTGTANAQAFISGIGYTIVPTGLRVMLKIGPTLTNTGPATLNMDSIGDVAIQDQTGGDLEGDELKADCYREFVYNGTNWMLLESPITNIFNSTITYVTLEETTIISSSPVSVVEFTQHLDAEHSHYIFEFFNVVPSTLGAYLRLRHSIDGGTTYIATDNYYNAVFVALGGIAIDIRDNFTLSNGMTNTLPLSVASGIIDLFAPAEAVSPKQIMIRGMNYHTDVGIMALINMGNLNSTQAVNAIQFSMSAGTITQGTFRMYGVK